MLVTIKKFGPIDECCYDLSKDLIAIYGENNIGKSYSMQLLYLLIKALLNTDNYRFVNNYRFINLRTYSSDDKSMRKLIEQIDEFKKSSLSSQDISETVHSLVNDFLFALIGETFFRSFKNTFSSCDASASDDSFIQYKSDDFYIKCFLKTHKIIVGGDLSKVNLIEATSYYHKSRQTKNGLSIYVVKKEGNNELPIQAIIEVVFEKVNKILRLLFNEFSNVYFLPASRSGIYNGMTAFAPIVAELAKNKSFFTRKLEFPGLTEPISDYFITLSSFRNMTNEKYKDIYEMIENDILKGKVTYDRKENILLYVSDANEIKFKMTEVSSMVSEIAPIVAYLKFIINDKMRYSYLRAQKSKPIIFIEEPEAHLHPKNQVKLAKAFTDLVNNDVRLIISSHSNYIFNKFNNLILNGELDFKKYQPVVIVKENSTSKSFDMEIDELGVVDKNFSDTSYDLLQEREEIIEKLNSENSD